jgi:uncharacterized protein (TIGR03437 family)
MRFLALFFSAYAFAGEYSTYIGDQYPRNVVAIAADAAGNTYIVGNRGPANIGLYYAILDPIIVNPALPLIGTFTNLAPGDVFVAKLDPSGKTLFTRFFTGRGTDVAKAVAVDASGNIYIAGTTTSDDFPISNALQPQLSAFGSGFIMKLSNDGKTILYSSYFGGVNGHTEINTVAADSVGNVYLGGTTDSSDFPYTAGMPSDKGNRTSLIPESVAFISSLSAAGDKVLFSGAIGGGPRACSSGSSCFLASRYASIQAIALDGTNNLYFGGNTSGVGVRTTPGVLLPEGLGPFAGKITVGGTGVSYLTYLDWGKTFGTIPSGETFVNAVAADASGNLYVGGSTRNPSFSTTANAYQAKFGGGPIDAAGVPARSDGFIAKIKPDGSAFVWATYLGGSGADSVTSIGADAAGNVWASGTTASSEFPNAQGWTSGSDFLTELSPDGSALTYSARYPSQTAAQAMALDKTLFIHIAGAGGIISTIPSTAPASPKIFGIVNAASGPMSGRIAPAEVISIFGPRIGPATAVTASPMNGFYPTTLGGIQVMIGGLVAPLLYVSSSQINAVVPYDVSSLAPSTIQIIQDSNTLSSFPVWADTTDPGVFPGVLNQDGTLNSQANPAKSGSTVSLYATGWQTKFGSLIGQIATRAYDQCAANLLGPCLASGGIVTYGGSAPGLVTGVSQFNVQLDATTSSQVSLWISPLNQSVTVWVQQGGSILSLGQ